MVAVAVLLGQCVVSLPESEESITNNFQKFQIPGKAVV
jgi:hypothetical protein